MADIKKSEILFLYETSYNIPNGDPFTGEQRYDEETKKILVSDVRMKRYVRDYLESIENKKIYVSEKTSAGKNDAKQVLTAIVNDKEWNPQQSNDIGVILKSQIDVRLFGGISTLGDSAKNIKLKKDGQSDIECENGHVQFTGPVQFACLNPSLNRVNLRMHQNTSHFKSKEGNAQGAIGTTTIVPYSIVQIHGWVNPQVATETGMNSDDLALMYKGLWYGTSGDGSSHSRSKIGQNSILLLEIVYKEGKNKVYGVDRLVAIKPKDGKTEEQYRSMDDYEFDFSKLIKVSQSDKVECIRFYTEIDDIAAKLLGTEHQNKDNKEIQGDNTQNQVTVEKTNDNKKQETEKKNVDSKFIRINSL